MAGQIHRWRPALAIRLTWPVAPETLERLLVGDEKALGDDLAFARLLAILGADNPLGDFGIYQAVTELAPGWELFRPGTQASPTLGKPGQPQISPSVMVTIHVPGDADRDRLDAALDALIAAHPWEVPVIELAEIKLAVRER